MGDVDKIPNIVENPKSFSISETGRYEAPGFKSTNRACKVCTLNMEGFILSCAMTLVFI